ncbi:MFS transporter [Enemella dayhoffiae]|uniref:MFS transporter n=1 Tax=Enemella dayhoffiae TaxID=2016507 RepID=A0A255HBP1_9ACTN|nr:MFS transporter [Enemella dayhoffiae]
MWAIPTVRQVVLIGMLCRAPMFGASVLLTLHVVDRLDPRYTAAGVIAMAATLATGIAGPWRGRLLDRFGLRRTLLPSLLVMPVCWVIAPWVGYWPLLVLVVISGLFTVPAFSLVRQAIAGATTGPTRNSAMALDSVLAEIGFMIGPAAAVFAGTHWGTTWTLMIFQLLIVLGGLVLFIVNPPLHSEGGEGDTDAAPATRWLSVPVLAIFIATVATIVAVTATDLAVVAGMRALDSGWAIGWALAVWGLGSAVGGLLFGASGRTFATWLPLLGLGVTTVLVALSSGPVSMMLLLALAGLFCAPSFVATTTALSVLVPPRFRGEAFGWHGSMITAGGALTAPTIGLAIDQAGWPAGFLAGGAAAVLVALAWPLARWAYRRPRRAG